MKKILSIIAVCALTFDCFASGSFQINSPQSGLVNYTNSGSQSYTNVFEPPFTYAPVMSVFLTAGPTNSLPITNTVTATNFILQCAASTNCTFVWSAQPANPRIQYGTVSPPPVSGSTTCTNTFNPPYASAPTVVISWTGQGAATNDIPVITSVSATAFIYSYGVTTNRTVYWQAIGQCATPGTGSVTY